MQAQTKRHIRSGQSYSSLFPASSGKDTIIVDSGNARLEDTLQLMQKVIAETLADTALLAKQLEASDHYTTCKNIWDFVYTHIQYKMDATGIEQVRRPSRTWADRSSGVDCDCYTVFIGSILTNLGIPFTMRITKYGGKHHFQHVYPIVPTEGGHITLDCVADRFNHEVRYSEKKDILPDGPIALQGIAGLSGVDHLAIASDALGHSELPLRTLIRPRGIPTCIPQQRIRKSSKQKRNTHGRTASPYRFDRMHNHRKMKHNKDFDWLNFLIISGISVAAGVGIIRLLTQPKKAPKRKRKINTKKTGRTP